MSDRGFRSYVTQENVIDHITISSKLVAERATVNFVVLEEGLTTLKIYIAAGQEVAILYSGHDSFGTVRTVALQYRPL